MEEAQLRYGVSKFALVWSIQHQVKKALEQCIAQDAEVVAAKTEAARWKAQAKEEATQVEHLQRNVDELSRHRAAHARAEHAKQVSVYSYRGR